MYTYKIKLTIFGKEINAKVKADTVPEAALKLMQGIFRRVKMNDLTIETDSGQEISEEGYKRQVEEAKAFEKAFEAAAQRFFEQTAPPPFSPN